MFQHEPEISCLLSVSTFCYKYGTAVQYTWAIALDKSEAIGFGWSLQINQVQINQKRFI